MNILVTGGTGYIGSHTVVSLIEQGYDVVVVDNLSNSYKFIIEQIKKITGKLPVFEKIDLCNKDLTDNLFRKYNFDAVIHFAAFKSVVESYNNPVKYYYNNINALLNTIDSCQKYKCNNFVFSSSCTVYGQPDIIPVSEEYPVTKAKSPYGNTKIASEHIIEDVTIISDIKAISLRYFNPVGAHHSALIGEIPTKVPDNLLPYITQTAAGIRERLLVFGNDYNTADGTCLRDYIHIMDLVNAHIKTLERLLNNKSAKYEIFNIGTGVPLSVLQIIEEFQETNKVELNYKFVERRKGDVEAIWANTEKAKNVLGWQPEYNIKDIVKSAWDWQLYLVKNIKLENI